MIRFIDIKKQYWGIQELEEELCSNTSEFEDQFAFIDTVIDRFVDMGDCQYWDCWDDFVESYGEGGGWREIPLDSFKSLLDPKFF